MSEPSGESDHAAAEQLRDRFRGMLLGLALGDALGAAVQHRRPGTFSRVGDLLGGGPYDLPRGAWSDDAATALLCADSVIDCGALQLGDVMDRWDRWRRNGLGSSTGRCLGISAAMAAALSPAGSAVADRVVDAEPFPRAAVVAAFEFSEPSGAAGAARALANLTHTSPTVLDATGAYALAIVAALHGTPSHALMDDDPRITAMTSPEWMPTVTAVRAAVRLQASNVADVPPSGGDALGMLSLVYHATRNTQSYKEAILVAVNTGRSSDVAGAATGALAGALYGAHSLPPHWLAALIDRSVIEACADRLLVAALTRLMEEPPGQSA